MKEILRAARPVVSLVSLAIALSACGSGVQFVRMDMTEYPPKDSDAVIEIHDGGVTRPHVVIGTLTAGQKMKTSFTDVSTRDQVLGSLTDYARKIGADALINVKPVGGEDLSTRVEMSATAIRYLNPGKTIGSRAS
jgi:hypothetical protein